MSLFDRMELKTVNEGINTVRTTPGAFLVDIRPKDAFKTDHVQGAVNIPSTRLDLAENRIKDKSALIYIVGDYYHKPRVGIKGLKKMGFTNVHSCGYMEEHNVRPM